MNYATPLLFLASLSLASAQADRMTYQGRLEKDGVPLTGSYSLQLHIYDAATGGTAVHFQNAAATAVNGQFTTQLGPFAANVFNGADRWLQVSVDDPAVAGLNYIPLLPRTSSTAAP